MEWTPDLVEGVGSALNEATVSGIDCDPQSGVCRVLLEVVALPEVGPIDPDPRRVLILSGVTSVDVLFRRDGVPPKGGMGPAVPLPTMAELETLFASLAWSHPMYSWQFIDDQENPKQRWPAEPSLQMTRGSGSGPHSLYWFTECGLEENPDEFVPYLLEGIVQFADASVERAGGEPLPLAEFIADAGRWWRAFSGGDPRLSVDAQQLAAARAPSWRSNLAEKPSTIRVEGER